jgi:hypothetical protein
VSTRIPGDSRAVVVHNDVREQGYGNGRATPEGVIVVAAFVMVLVSVSCAVVAVAVAVAVALRVVGVVHVLDVHGE